MPIPQGMDEAAYLGAYFNEPLDLVKAETVDLHVPATAEIVVEGHISHTDLAEEDEKFSFKTTKVIHNCLLADRFSIEKRPKRSDFLNSWTPEIQAKISNDWHAYGFR